MQPSTHWTIAVADEGGSSGWRATAVDTPHVGAWGATRELAVERIRRLIASIEHVEPGEIHLTESTGPGSGLTPSWAPAPP